MNWYEKSPGEFDTERGALPYDRVAIAPFKCATITGSSFIQRVFYDENNAYMLINLSGTWYHYFRNRRGNGGEPVGRGIDGPLLQRID
jgi:hypothetical protein